MNERWSIFEKNSGQRLTPWVYPSYAQAEKVRTVTQFGEYGPSKTETLRLE